VHLGVPIAGAPAGSDLVVGLPAASYVPAVAPPPRRAAPALRLPRESTAAIARAFVAAAGPSGDPLDEAFGLSRPPVAPAVTVAPPVSDPEPAPPTPGAAATPQTARRDMLGMLGLSTSSSFAVASTAPAAAPSAVSDAATALPPPSGGTLGQRAAAVALRYLGVPYVWGAADPAVGFDCSGLVQYAYAQVGVSLIHYAAAQWHEGRHLTSGEVRAGDLVFFEPEVDGPGHVGIYLGGGLFVQAPHTGDVVRVSSFADAHWASIYMGAVRPY
jgi:cell wall-associated NlpC family hydrolase